MNKAALKKYLATNKGKWHYNNKPLMSKALNFTCQKCQRQFNAKRLQIHHFEYNYKSGVYGYGWKELYQNDIITLLCVTCHTWWHQNNSIYGIVDKKEPTTSYSFNCGYQDTAFAYSKCKKCNKGKMQSIQYNDFQERIVDSSYNCKECGIWYHKAEEELGIYYDHKRSLCQDCIEKIDEQNKFN